MILGIMLVFTIQCIKEYLLDAKSRQSVSEMEEHLVFVVDQSFY